MYFHNEFYLLCVRYPEKCFRQTCAAPCIPLSVGLLGLLPHDEIDETETPFGRRGRPIRAPHINHIMAGYINLDTGLPGGANKLLVEVAGTFFVSLALFNFSTDTTLGALGVGLMLTLMISVAPPGHFNPAVSMAYTIAETVRTPDQADGLVEK